MNLIQYIKLLLKYRKWLIIVPFVSAVTVFLMTIKSKKQYISSTSLYTGVASGYSITSTEDERLDYFAVNNAFDNLVASAKSRETIEQVSLRLLSEHLLLTKPNPQILDAEGFAALKKLVGDELFSKAKTFKNADEVFKYINGIYSSKVDNQISRILDKKESFYNIDDLKSNLVVTRINTSDILQVTYTCSDPAVCQRIIELHTAIFTANYNGLKSDQTASAVQYFEQKLADVKASLVKSEDNLRDFGQKNSIINYYEQTRYIAQSKEEVDKAHFAQQIEKNGSKQAMDLSEKKLHSREDQINNSTNIIKLREHLSALNTDIEKAALYGNQSKVKELTTKENAVEDSIKSASKQYMNLNYTLETVPRANLIDEWVKNAVSYDKANAGLSVLKNQKEDYLNKVSQFAPLGSTLKQLDREVDIHQEEFMAILRGLNLARLRQSNLSLNSNIVIQDKPFFPLQAQPSTRGLLIIVSFFVGLLLVISVAIGRELMDSSIRNPERAKKFIGLPVTGISIKSSGDIQLPYQQQLQNLLTEQLISNMLPFISSIGTDKTPQISLLTTKSMAMQSDTIILFHNLFSLIFKKIYWIVPQADEEVFRPALPEGCCSIYIPSVSQLNLRTAGELVGKDLSESDLVFYVSPGLAQNCIPVSIAQSAVINLLVVNADETWQNADKEIVAKLEKSITGVPLHTWLVNADETNLETTIGEIPKKRSWLRRKVKKMITLNLR
jgi:uncharacterized protein involved in exopolysaccharide biosynthesis